MVILAVNVLGVNVSLPPSFLIYVVTKKCVTQARECQKVRLERKNVYHTVYMASYTRASRTSLGGQELTEESADLICALCAKGVSSWDVLAAGRHRRQFARARREHPLLHGLYGVLHTRSIKSVYTVFYRPRAPLL